MARLVMLRLEHKPAAGALRLALVLAGALGLAGCGVKGPLEPPPGAHVTAPAPASEPVAASSRSASSMSVPQSANDMANSVSGQPNWKNNSQKGESSTNLLQGAQRPNQSFILDGLL